MKYLKSYRLFESQEIIDAGIENAINNNNIELFNQLVVQYPDMIDYNKMMNVILSDAKFFHLLDIMPQEYLDAIETLYCKKINLTDLEWVYKFKNLKELDCSLNNISSLKGIEKCKNLEKLSCSYNPLTSLNELKFLTNLKILNVIETDINNLKGVETLTNLKHLDVSYNKNLITLKGVENLTNLNELIVKRLGKFLPKKVKRIKSDIDKLQKYYTIHEE